MAELLAVEMPALFCASPPSLERTTRRDSGPSFAAFRSPPTAIYWIRAVIAELKKCSGAAAGFAKYRIERAIPQIVFPES